MITTRLLEQFPAQIAQNLTVENLINHAVLQLNLDTQTQDVFAALQAELDRYGLDPEFAHHSGFIHMSEEKIQQLKLSSQAKPVLIKQTPL